jgi:hypothetical protein
LDRQWQLRACASRLGLQRRLTESSTNGLTPADTTEPRRVKSSHNVEQTSTAQYCGDRVNTQRADSSLPHHHLKHITTDQRLCSSRSRPHVGRAGTDWP